MFLRNLYSSVLTEAIFVSLSVCYSRNDVPYKLISYQFVFDIIFFSILLYIIKQAFRLISE